MAIEAMQKQTCVICGAQGSGFSFFHGESDKDLWLCKSCHERCKESLTNEQLSNMTVSQVKRFLEVRDALAARYKNEFVATKTFYAGRKRDVPVFEVDEKHLWWALPNAKTPMAQSLRSISDFDVSLNAESLDEISNDSEVDPAISKLAKLFKENITAFYKSKHTDLAPIPDGELLTGLWLSLTLNDRESGLSKVSIDLCPLRIDLPSDIDAGYDCAYEIIEYMRGLARAAYEQMQAKVRATRSGNDILSILLARGGITTHDEEVLRYYLERTPRHTTTGDAATPFSLVRDVLDSVSENLVYGHKAPTWQTQHTADSDIFFGALYRYAPGLLLCDIVAIVDDTKLHNGKGGMLFAMNSFAVDAFSSPLKAAGLQQPIAYDDLLFVRRNSKQKQLILRYRNGQSVGVPMGKYGHYLFAVINCILLLRRQFVRSKES